LKLFISSEENCIGFGRIKNNGLVDTRIKNEIQTLSVNLYWYYNQIVDQLEIYVLVFLFAIKKTKAFLAEHQLSTE
jgi:hypothetical protein